MKFVAQCLLVFAVGVLLSVLQKFSPGLVVFIATVAIAVIISLATRYDS